MAVDINTGFANEDRLLDIREKLLNPIAVKVASMETSARALNTRVEETFKEAAADIPNKRITLTRDNDNKVFVNLTGMFNESSGITIKDEQNGSVKEPDAITFKDSTVAPINGTGAYVSYDWGTIVPDNQFYMTIGKTGDTATSKPKALYFKGTGVDVEYGTDITTVTIADPPPLIKAQVGSGDVDPIDTIRVHGNVGTSAIAGNILTITLPDGGSGGISNQNFKGFFSSLGDIISEVQDPVNGMSFAFAKDSKYGGEYYTPYLYVNNGWTELKQDPALLYSAPTAPTAQGVFSIKPDPKITIDSNGQLDLSKLGEDTPGFFHGFYDNLTDLENAVPTPTISRSFAYTKHTNGAWIGRKYQLNSDGTKSWGIMAPISAISLVESSGSGAVPAPVYGFYKNGMIEIDGNGLATIKGAPESSLKMEIADWNGNVVTGNAKTIQFMAGKSYATLQNDKLYLNHPQRVIEYAHTFEDDHNTNDYMGNIFYDKTSRCWMGWGVPEAAGGVDTKWTRIAHPKMSDEVRDLLKRVPPKAPHVLPGVLGDNAKWEYTSWTYIEQGDSTLPDEIQRVCGAYIFTIVQEVDNDRPIPTERIQICYADQEGSNSYVRRWNKGTGSPGSSDYGWFPWVRTSLTTKDIDNHNQNHEAHKEGNRFYKVCTFDTLLKDLKNNQYIIKDKDMMLLADNRGISADGEDAISVPYTGSYVFAGKFTFEGLAGTGTNHPISQWLLRLYRVRNGQSTVIFSTTYNHSDSTKPMASMKWESKALDLEYGDKISFYIQPLNDDGWKTYYPDARFVPLRSYLVIQDSQTRAGTRIAETQRKLMGVLQSKQDTGVNVHYSAGQSGLIRVYGTPINVDFKTMSNV